MRQFLIRNFKSICVAAMILVFGACDLHPSEDVPIIDETFGIKFTFGDRYIDKYGNMGIVAYVSDRYIIAISCDETELSWGIMGQTVMPKDTISAINTVGGYGIDVLRRMRSLGIENFPAQKWCDDKNRGEDVYAGCWHLPSAYTLQKLTDNGKKDLLNKRLRIGGTQLSDEEYWSCVEDLPGCGVDADDDTLVGEIQHDSDNRAIPIVLPYSANYSKSSWQKKDIHRVRAIKYIYLNLTY